MVALYENGIIPHIQIHDEVDISVESPQKAEEIIEIMESAVELEVPNKVDFEQGDNWVKLNNGLFKCKHTYNRMLRQR